VAQSASLSTLRLDAPEGEPTATGRDLVAGGKGPSSGTYLGQFDSFRVIACCAVVLQHSLLWNVAAGNTTAWAFVMLLHFSRTAFAVVLLQLYLVFPLVLRLVRRSTHHVAIMVVSLLFALLLAADLHYTQYFGVVGDATRSIASVYPWARDPITYQEQFVAGILVALHFDEVRSFVERRWRQVIALGVVMGIVATTWYLVAVWTGSQTGRASDLYQPVAFLWFTAAVAALECGTYVWYRRQCRLADHPRRWPRFFTAEYLAGLTGGIFFAHVLFLNLLRTWLADVGLAPHLGWAGLVALTFVLTITCSGVCTALLLKTPLRWVLTGPVRSEQRTRLGRDFPAETHTR